MGKGSRRRIRNRAIDPPTPRPSRRRHQLDSGRKDVHPDLPCTAEETQRNWAALPRDVLWVILSLVPQVDILRGAGRVCGSWRRLAHDEPLFWRHIDLAAADEVPLGRWQPMACAAVRRSAGRCESFRGRVNSNFLLFLTQRAPSLRSLHMTSELNTAIEKFMTVVAKKLPLLEELVLSGGGLVEEASLAALVDRFPRLQLLDASNCHTWGPIDTLRAKLEGRIKDLRLPYQAFRCR